MKHPEALYLLLLLSSFFACSRSSSSIVFTTLGRSRYAFDIFTLPISISDLSSSLSFSKPKPSNEVKITDGESVNYNGFFPQNPSSLLSLLSPSPPPPPDPQPQQALVYVSERNASFNIYLDLYYHPPSPPQPENRRRSILQTPKIQIALLRPEENKHSLSMKDKPLISGEHLIYVSTHEKSELPRKSWTAVYSTHLRTGETRRLTPLGVADYSPAVSPSGEWTAVVSDGERGWGGEIEDLKADIYVFRTRDGSERTKVVDHGGWPCWADDSTIYFHRQSDDGWWSVYKAILQTPFRVDSVVIERVTPPGFHAFTPAAAGNGDGNFIAIATRRPTSEFRHIELLDLTNNLFVEITKPISPNAHHYNPFISPDTTQIGYHRCRGSSSGSPLLLENLRSPLPGISLFRVDGSFPSFSPKGDRIAFVGFPGLYIINSDGTGKREVFSGTTFSTSWDWKRKGVIYTSHGPTFATERTKVDIISIHLEEEAAAAENQSLSPYFYKKLTTNGENNAFPSPSPDGKWVAFRSGRSGYKNLYIMDAVEGEKAGLRRLTEGPWTDTMCSWSPDGAWIAFASDRDDPGSGSFALYLVHPDGSGLKKAFHSGEGGRTNHPWFSPDSKRIVFTSDYAGVSAEPIANPHHYQPYGDIFVANVDGSGITRLTHNSYEDGTPTWGPMFMKPVDVVEGPSGVSRCEFDDCHWLALGPVGGVSYAVSSVNRTCVLP